MNTPRKHRTSPTFFDQRQTKAAFLNLFGSHSLLVIFLGSITIISLNWFGDGIWRLIVLGGKQLISPALAGNQVLPIIGRIIWFPCLLAWWWLLIRKSFDEVANLIVHEQTGVAGCKVLIIFLSLPGQDVPLIQNLLASSASELAGKIKELQFREQFRSWRMPLEAIHYHLQQNTLERIMVIPSATVQTVNGKPNEGTYKYFHDFRMLVEKTTSGLSVHQAGESENKWMTGVDYESARALRDCLADVFEFWLDTQGYREEDILIDITSGQKLCSSIATLLSLQKGRQIQYVSTTDYTVKSYNIDYEAK